MIWKIALVFVCACCFVIVFIITHYYRCLFVLAQWNLINISFIHLFIHHLLFRSFFSYVYNISVFVFRSFCHLCCCCCCFCLAFFSCVCRHRYYCFALRSFEYFALGDSKFFIIFQHTILYSAMSE